MKRSENILYLICILSFFSCNKTDDNLPEESYRVHEMILEHDSVPQTKYGFTYEGEHVIEVNQYYRSDTTWKEDLRVLFSYQDNKITNEYYFVRNGELEYYRKNIFTVENDRLVEDVVYAGSRNEWYLNGKWNFTYANDRLSEYKVYRYVDNFWVERGSAYFNYDGPQIQEHRYYERHDEVDYLTDCDTFFWDNNKIVQIVDYNRKYNKIELNSNSLFAYAGEYVSEIELQARRNDEWREYRTNYYEYNEDNLLISDYNSWGYATHFNYEKGKGNFGIVYYLPYEIVFNRPMFKSTDDPEESAEDFLMPGYIDYLLFQKPFPI